MFFFCVAFFTASLPSWRPTEVKAVPASLFVIVDLKWSNPDYEDKLQHELRDGHVHNIIHVITINDYVSLP